MQYTICLLVEGRHLQPNLVGFVTQEDFTHYICIHYNVPEKCSFVFVFSLSLSLSLYISDSFGRSKARYIHLIASVPKLC